MLAIEVRFLMGRYHATPWARHPNEGVAEWPPSPWRLLRALTSSFRMLGQDSDQAFDDLIAQLTNAGPPSFHLPTSTKGHSRHYVLVGEERKLLLNAFTAVDSQQPMVFLWPELTLTVPQKALLDRLLQGINYLGRSESLAEMTATTTEWSVQSRPASDSDRVTSLVRVLCPELEASTGDIAQATATLRKQGRLCPPKARWISYHLDEAQSSRSLAAPTTVLTYKIQAGRTVERGAGLALADRVRRAILALGSDSPTLTGRRDGQPREDGHRHLHILPDGPAHGDGLKWVRLWAPEGFSAADLDALAGLRNLPAGDKQSQIRLLPWGSSGADGKLQAVSLTWMSYTPFLLARHPKANGSHSAEEQLRRECAQRGLPAPIIEAMPSDDREYQVHRGPRKGPPGPPLWFRLTFPTPVQGPLCLGAASHFGMGRFVPTG